MRFKQYLQEKLIMYGQGKKYGQIVFLAGGGGSGKGFAIKKFMESEKFKIRDVDEWKSTLLKISELKNKYPEINGLNLRNPKDVFKLHKYVNDLGILSKTLAGLLKDLKSDRLPNILFDVTLSDTYYLEKYVPMLLELGYNPKDIHITWVLTNYHVAVKANRERKRIVPDDVLLKTHEGAALTMNKILKGKIPNGVDGDINVVLNNRENTVVFVNDDGTPIKRKGNFIVKDFKYIRVKKSGSPIVKNEEVEKQLYDWVTNNVPMTKMTKELWDEQ